MKNLLTINPTTAAGAIGLAIDLAVLENTARIKPEIDKKQIIDIEAYVQYFYTNGFYCIDKDGLKFSMRYYS